MTKEEIIWEAPPPTQYTSGPRPGARRQAMDANPGKWLVWGKTKSRNNASGPSSHLRTHGYEVATRMQPDGQIVIYARRPEKERKG